jgi:ATP-dependent helicase YprA (DUF1998 family)
MVASVLHWHHSYKVRIVSVTDLHRSFLLLLPFLLRPGPAMPATPASKATSKPPLGTRHKVKSFKCSLASKLATLEKELERLPSLIKLKFKKWTNGARDFQLACMRAQVLKKDVLLQAATGSGKTGIAAGPHLLPSSKGKVTLMVSPLLVLEDEQVWSAIQ